MDKIEIELLQREDVGKAAALEAENFSQPFHEHDFMQSLENPNHYHYVLKRNEQLIAQCSVSVIVGQGELNNISVQKKYENQGFARRLLTYILTQKDVTGVSEYTLEVRKSNQYAIKLYESLGFQTEGVRKNFYENPIEDALIMWKR